MKFEGVKLLMLPCVVVFDLAGERADLPERAIVEQEGDAVAHGRPARGDVAGNPLRAAHLPGQLPPAANFFEFRLPGHCRSDYTRRAACYAGWLGTTRPNGCHCRMRSASTRPEGQSGSSLGLKASAVSAVLRARPKPAATCSGLCASLPKHTASPPSSRHQPSTAGPGHRYRTGSRPRVVFTSSATPRRAAARRTARILSLEQRFVVCRLLRPVALRVVQVSEHLERHVTPDHRQHLAEVECETSHQRARGQKAGRMRRPPCGPATRCNARSPALGRTQRPATLAPRSGYRCGSPISTPERMRSSG